MPNNKQRIGWIGMGRMGFPMAERLIKAGHDVSIWNRTRAKAEPLAARGGKIVGKPVDLADVDVLFSIVSTGKDLAEVYFGKKRIPVRAWKTHDLRNRTIRLVQSGLALMRGGYRDLLRPRRRDK